MTLSHLLYTNDASDCKQKAAGIHIYQNFYRSHIYQQHFHLLSMHQFFVFICFFCLFVVFFCLFSMVQCLSGISLSRQWHDIHGFFMFCTWHWPILKQRATNSYVFPVLHEISHIKNSISCWESLDFSSDFSTIN